MMSDFSSQKLHTSYPIDKYERHILYLLEKKQILVIVGETGTGKSIRIPGFILNSGAYNAPLKHSEDTNHGKTNRYRQMCITQPRRVAAVQLAQRLAQETNCDLGSTVGYAVRFDEVCDPELTMVKYMTEGLLLREMVFDPTLDKYSVIMIDEVHERNLNTDILLALLKCILLKRHDLKLILCSATADIEKIQDYFTYSRELIGERLQETLEPAVLLTRGKSYPIKIYHTRKPVPNYLDASVEAVKGIHENSRLASGKILIFLTGQDEVEHVCERLNDFAMTLTSRLDVLQLLPLPLHASLRPEEMSKAFDEHGRNKRVCIVSTNVAETSLTISGIAFVIDCGFVKIKTYDHKTAFESLVRVPISKSAAKQRAGRAGRTREGVVYRLYPELQYKQMREMTVPEIQRSPLMEVIMSLKSLGVDDVSRFPLMDSMPDTNLVAALELLYALQAIDERGNLTATGELMALFNLDPRISKMLISLESAGCTQEACKIAAMLQVKDIYTKTGRSFNDLWQNTNLVSLCTTEGDMISYLNIINSFLHNQKSQKWAERRCLNHKALLNAVQISEKLQTQLKRSGLSLTSSTGRTELISKSVVAGLFPNTAYLHPSGDYKTVKGDQTVFLHPTSVFNELIDRPKLVVFVEIVQTTKPYMRHIMAVDQKMLLDVAPHYYTFSTNLEMMRNKFC